MTSTTPEDINVADIETSAATQMRVDGVDENVVAEYARDMEAGAAFPPVSVFRDDAGRYWLADGFHRVAAARKADMNTVNAVVHNGGQRDAVLMACSVNAQHGVRRTQADRRKAIETLLRDPDWNRWSNREIARQCNVDHKTVASVRDELSRPAGEIPKRGSEGGEIPRRKTGGTTARVLAGLPDQDLLEECRRRGWTVEVPR